MNDTARTVNQAIPIKRFKDRTEAGIILAKQLEKYSSSPEVIALALPRGGVPVAYEVAQALSIPLDVLIVRKLGVPWHEELAFGALASGNSLYLNELLIRELGIKQSEIDAIILAEQKELARREKVYRMNKPFPDLKNKTVILIDDGIATGATMQAAIYSVQQHQPQSIVVAVPVAAPSTCQEMAPLVEAVVCPLQPADFCAVALWYEAFPQTSDEEVIQLLQ